MGSSCFTHFSLLLTTILGQIYCAALLFPSRGARTLKDKACDAVISIMRAGEYIVYFLVALWAQIMSEKRCQELLATVANIKVMKQLDGAELLKLFLRS